MNACSDYASTGVSSALTLNVVSRRFSDEVEEDGCGRASPSSASPAFSFLSAPPAVSAATAAEKGVRDQAGPTTKTAMTATAAKAAGADEKVREVTKGVMKKGAEEREKAKADRRARDLAAVRSLTAQISDMLARQRIGDGNESESQSEPAVAAAEPEPEPESEPRQRQQQDKEEEEKSQQQETEDGSDEDEWANASLAFIVDDYQREWRRDHDSYSKILGASRSGRSSRRRVRVRSTRLGASVRELGGSEGAAEEISAPPAPIAKMGGGKFVDANASNPIMRFPGSASRKRCNASHALSA